MSILEIISLIAPAIALVVGWQRRFALLWFYAAVGLLLDNLGLLLKHVEINHHVSGNVFILAELLFISSYYRKHIFPIGNLFYVWTGFLVVGFVIHTICTDPLLLNFAGLGILCAIYTGYGIAGYLKLLRNREVTYLSNSSFFWINTAFFLYGTTCCLLFLFATYLQAESWELLLSIWLGFFTIVNILRYIFIGIGLYKTKPGEA